MAGRFLIIIVLLTVVSVAQQKPAPDKAKWEGLVAKIEHVLSHQGNTCPGQGLHIAIKDAAQIAENSVALVDYCPGGAYNDLDSGNEARSRPACARPFSH